MFIGYSPTQKGYKCYVPETKRVLISRDVKFMEEKSFYEGSNWSEIKGISTSSSDRAAHLRQLLDSLGISQPCDTRPSGTHANQPEAGGSEASENLDHEGGNVSESAAEYSDGHDQDEAAPEQNEAEPEQDYTDEAAPEQNEAEPEQDNTESNHDQVIQENQGGEQNQGGEPSNLRRSTRQKFPPSHWKHTRVYYNSNAVAHPEQGVCNLAHIPQEHQAFTSSFDQEQVPRTYEEAKEHKVWRDAVGDERSAMERNHTWDESDLPKGKKTVSSRWIFTIKYKSNGEIERYKARLVARGFTQTYGDDYRDTFAPVAKLHTIRVVLSLATNLEWNLWQMDVKNAFLQGELEEEVYMTPPPGLEDTVAPGKVLRLRKAIYGLKQSPRAWYHKLSVTLRDRGFRRSEADHTLC